MQILAIDSNPDPATQMIYAYRNQHVYPYLESKGFRIIRCQGASARRDIVASEARRDDIIYITGAGHGDKRTYTGNCEPPIFQVGTYQPEEANGKVVHLLSCETAAELGPDFVKHGCRAYFGYNDNFTFPLIDIFADLFLECASEVDRAFADGLTAEKVYDRVIARYNQGISELKEVYDHVSVHYNQGISVSELEEVYDRVITTRYNQGISELENEGKDKIISSSGWKPNPLGLGGRSRSFGLRVKINLTFDTNCGIINISTWLGFPPLLLKRVLTAPVERGIECEV